MTLLVIGRTGQLARELAALRPGATCVGREAADLTDPEGCAAAIRSAAPAAVINAAAWTAVDAAEAEEEAARVVNAEAPGAMARACADLGVPFVHVSTDYVFDGAGDEPHGPDAPIAPLGAYGRTKAAGEKAVREAGGAHAIVRTSWVFSAHGANFVTTMLRLARTRDALNVVGDQVGGPTPAASLAEICLAAADVLARDASLTGTYHHAGAPDVSWADFAREIFAVAGRDVAVTAIPSEAYPTPAPRPRNSRLDCASTEAAFGVARPDWRGHLKRVIAALEG